MHGIISDPAFDSKLSKLIDLSRERHHFAFTRFAWPAQLDENQWWLSPELLTIHGTPLFDELSQEQLQKLSKWECINLFSLNVEGERELVSRLSAGLHLSYGAAVDDYLHHFIDEENQHMWFFAEFCRRYGGKIYDSKRAALSSEKFSSEMETFLLFSRIVIFEDVGCHYNLVCSNDERLHPLLREINDVHRAEEARHLTFGRSMLKQMAAKTFGTCSPEELEQAALHLDRYMEITIQSLYQPAMYRDAGLGSGMAIRKNLLSSPERKAFHLDVLLKRSISLFNECGLRVKGYHDHTQR